MPKLEIMVESPSKPIQLIWTPARLKRFQGVVSRAANFPTITFDGHTWTTAGAQDLCRYLDRRFMKMRTKEE